MTLVLHELKTPLIEGKTVREEEPLNDNQVSRCDLILPYFKNKNSNFHEFLKTKFTKSLNAKEEGEEKEYLAKDKYDDLERLKTKMKKSKKRKE